jgi:Fur family ferric uptake transcriptional regulator
VKNVSALFEDFLRSHDLRLTRQRLEILRVIYRTHKHVSAEDLYEMLKADGSASALRISRATVYRTLGLLAEGGFVQALDLGRDRGTLYEHTMGHEHHDHMICLACGKIIEFHDDRLEEVQARAIERHGFAATSHRLNVFGKCSRCQKKK